MGLGPTDECRVVSVTDGTQAVKCGERGIPEDGGCRPGAGEGKRGGPTRISGRP